MHGDSLLGQYSCNTKECLGSDPHSISLIFLLVQGPRGSSLTNTYRSKHFVALFAKGSSLESNGMLMNSVHRRLIHPKANRDETRIDRIHDREVRDPYRQ